jgi:hypothetical protein
MKRLHFLILWERGFSWFSPCNDVTAQWCKHQFQNRNDIRLGYVNDRLCFDLSALSGKRSPAEQSGYIPDDTHWYGNDY